MSTRLDPQALDRLVKLLGMLGSAHAGERSAAGLKANELVRGMGLTWSEVFTRIMSAPATDSRNNGRNGGGGRHNSHNSGDDDWRTMREFCARHSGRLRPRELEFVIDLGDWRGDLTQKQSAWLTAIFARLKHTTGGK
jgi:hypothetical protein